MQLPTWRGQSHCMFSIMSVAFVCPHGGGVFTWRGGQSAAHQRPTPLEFWGVWADPSGILGVWADPNLAQEMLPKLAHGAKPAVDTLS